jgi:peroxiredoxin
VGGKYLDFTAPDLAGEIYTLSKLIQGKYAIIDIWYPWCGPCIVKSRKLVPIYNDFHDTGFTVVGVAGDVNNLQAIMDRLDKDKYPWITLISPGDQNNIWNLYDISNLGGSTFMVDPSGTILALDPTSDEIRAILQKNLNNIPESMKVTPFE